MIWVEFIICAGLIILTSTLLSKYGDVIAEKTGLGRAWVGAILIAGVTSLPELASGVSAVTLLNAPNLAAGAVMGSCLFNLMLIAVMDLTYQPGRVLAKAQEVHILSGGLGVLLLGLVAMGVLLGPVMSGIGIFGIGLLSVVIAVLYAIGGRMIAGLEKERMGEVLAKEARDQDYADISKGRAFLIFIASAMGVILLGIWLATIGDRLAMTTGLSRSFVGNVFLAVSTSLPEIAASLSAIRLNAIDLAIGNVLGSNLFNVLLLSVYAHRRWACQLLVLIDQCQWLCCSDDHDDDRRGDHQPDVPRLSAHPLSLLMGRRSADLYVSWLDIRPLSAWISI